MVLRAAQGAGIPTGTLHTLRHTAATLALTAGVPVHIVAARRGNDPKTVLSTYAHLLPQSDELAAERVEAALGRERLTDEPLPPLTHRSPRRSPRPPCHALRGVTTDSDAI